MKTIKFVLLILSFSVLSIFVQSVAKTDRGSGIFLSANDFQNNKLELPSSQAVKYKLQLNNFWGNKSIVVISNGKKHVFQKDEIFGYRDKGQDYRFFNSYSDPFRILAKKNILIYDRQFYGDKQNNFKPIRRYYFSVTPDSPVQGLTLSNIKNAFANNEAVLDAIHANFQSDQDLAEYDPYHHTYRLNYIISKAEQSKKAGRRMARGSI